MKSIQNYMYKISSGANVRKLIYKHVTSGKAFLEFCGNDKNGKSTKLKNLSKKTKQKYDVVWLKYATRYNDNIVEDLQALPPLLAKKGILFVTLQRGQVPWFPKGTIEELINMANEEMIKDKLLVEGLGTHQFFKEGYFLKAKKKSSTKRIVFGFKWIKWDKVK